MYVWMDEWMDGWTHVWLSDEGSFAMQCNPLLTLNINGGGAPPSIKTLKMFGIRGILISTVTFEGPAFPPAFALSLAHALALTPALALVFALAPALAPNPLMQIRFERAGVISRGLASVCFEY